MAIALAATLAVARPLFPSEDAEAGSGLIIVALWGVVGVLWGAAQATRGTIRCFAGLVDAAAILLVTVVAVSAFQADTVRPAINMTAEWAGLVLSFLLVRQLFRNLQSQQTLAVAMLITAAVLSLYGIYQAYWGLEPLRAEYERNPARILESLGIAPGSSQQATFENRLRSHEPFATFALANSLAGFLIAWFPVAIAWGAGQVASESRTVQARAARVLFAGFVILAVVACILMTQSRTAYVAGLVQLLALGWVYTRGNGSVRFSPRVVWGVGIIAALTFGLLIATAIARGKIDEKLVTEATKSFAYRWEYWRGTAALIREHFWLGTGPGNFRGHYLAHKVVGSSEEIADPHNFILETWATCGVFATLLLLLVLGLGIARSMRWRVKNESELIAERRAAEISVANEAGLNRGMLLVAGAAGLGLSSLLSHAGAPISIVLAAVWLALAAGFCWFSASEWLDSRVLGVSAAGIALNLLGAGGMLMPGVGQSLWLLLALGLNRRELSRAEAGSRGTGESLLWYVSDATRRVWVGPAPTRLLLLAWLVVVAAFGMWVVRPVTASQAAIGRGRWLKQQGDMAGAERQYQAAAAADPLSAEPWTELSRIQYERWLRLRGRAADEAFSAADIALRRAADLAPSRLEPRQLLGDLYQARARATQDRQDWLRAAEVFEQCVQMYPTSARLYARWGVALWEADRQSAARAAMARALELDAATPHVDKKLDEADRRRFADRLDGTP